MFAPLLCNFLRIKWTDLEAEGKRLSYDGLPVSTTVGGQKRFAEDPRSVNAIC